MKTNVKSSIIIGVIGADCHAVGNKIISSVLTDLGFNVINLGVMVTQDEYIDAVIKHDAKAVLVSSIYGHGEIDCRGLRQRCEERGVGDTLLYVGGNLVIGKKSFEDVKPLFLDMGYDRVFSPKDDLDEVAEFLRMDIENREIALERYETA